MDDQVDPGTANEFGVSVIIPCYNYADYMSAAIESVLQQDYKNYELIVIDDGSTDNTAEITAKYNGKIRYIRQENQGLSATRNNGINYSLNDYICFLDADDEWEAGFLSRIMEEFKSVPEDVAVIACLDSKIGKYGESIEDREHNSKLGEITTKDILLKNRFFPGAAVIKKNVFKDVGIFDQSLRSSEDRDMWIRISCMHKIWLIPDRLIRVRKHGENMSSNARRMRENKLAVVRKSYEAGCVSKKDVLFWLKVNSLINYQISWIFYNQGEKLSSIFSIIKSLLLWPLMMDRNKIDVPILFRARALVRFLLPGLK